jgi:hypothetical protein
MRPFGSYQGQVDTTHWMSAYPPKFPGPLGQETHVGERMVCSPDPGIEKWKLQKSVRIDLVKTMKINKIG